MPSVTTGKQDYEYEPSPVAILDEIVPRFTELQLYQAVLESQASEHSARMVAMRNASDNAGQLVSDLTLVYNKARQAAITNEILDIVGGAEALQDSIDSAAEQILMSYQQEMLERKGAARPSPSTRPTPVVSAVTAASYAPAPTAVAEAAATPAALLATDDGKDDDLTRIEGIGPKMEAALKAAGINTFLKLSQSDEPTLRAAIEAAGMRLSPTLPTWAVQASFALRGDWEGLEKFQDQLGRRS